MAIILVKSGLMFVHIPKCYGHWVEAVLSANNIRFRQAECRREQVCPRHGRRIDYEPVKSAFCFLRPVDEWMRSYWQYHVQKLSVEGYEETKFWVRGVKYHHRHLGPPMPSYDEWVLRRPECESYLQMMAGDCDNVLQGGDPCCALTTVLRQAGYSISADQVRRVPPANVSGVITNA